MKCPICNTQTKYAFSKSNFHDSYDYARCPNCKFLFINPSPSAKQLDAYYNGAYQVQTAQEKKARNKAQVVLQHLREMKITDADILEIGSSYGYFLDEAKKQGYHVSGIEVDERTVKACKKQFKLKDVFVADTTTFKPKEKFDCIVMLDVIEHVSDLTQTMQFVTKNLKKGGVFIVTTPNTASIEFTLFGKYWEWVSPPAHIFLFNLYNFDVLMKKHKLQKKILRSWKGDSAGNTLFHAALTSRYLAAHAVRTILPESHTQKLYDNVRANMIENSESQQKEFTGIMGAAHSVANIFEPLFKRTQNSRGPSLLAIYQK